MLIEKPLSASLIASARAPSGDMAFAAAVAAFGQKLKGDESIGSFGWADIRRLAQGQSGFWRQEFTKLLDIAASMRGGAAVD